MPLLRVSSRALEQVRAGYGRAKIYLRRNDLWNGMSHVPDDLLAELGALHLDRVGDPVLLHEAREVVGDPVRADGAVHPLHDEVGRLLPAEVPEHELAGEDHGARVHLVEIRVLRGGAMGRLEDRVPGDVVRVPARRDPDAAHLRRERVGEVVAVQVRGRDDVELLGPREDLLERDVRDRVLHEDLALRELRLLLGGRRLLALRRLGPLPLLPGVDPVPELALGERVPVVPERALRVLHDVALVNEGDAPALHPDREVDGRAHEPLGPLARDRLHAEPARAREADLLVLARELPLEEAEELLRALRPGLPLDPGVDVLRVLPEDHHVDPLRVLHRRRHAAEPAHRAEADVEVEELPERVVERADAAADRRGERPLDADEVLAERLDRLVGEPGVELRERLLAGVDLGPGDAPRATVGLLDRGAEDAHRRAPDVAAGPVALDEGDDRPIRNGELSPDQGDLRAVLRYHRLRVGHRGVPRVRTWGAASYHPHLASVKVRPVPTDRK